MLIKFAVDVELLFIYCKLIKFFVLGLSIQLYIFLILSVVSPFCELFGFLGIFIPADLSISLKYRFIVSSAEVHKVVQVDFIREFF